VTFHKNHPVHFLSRTDEADIYATFLTQDAYDAFVRPRTRRFPRQRRLREHSRSLGHVPLIGHTDQ